jgi:hypothetical protein
MTVSELRERLRKIADEEQRQNLMGYQPDGGAGRLANSKPGTPMAAKVPHNLEIKQNAEGKWIGNGGQWGPFDSIRDLELAVYGRSDLSGAKRDWRDDARPADE